LSDLKKYIFLLTAICLTSEVFAYRLKDEDVVVDNGVIIQCIYDISSKGNVIEIPDFLDNQKVIGIGDYAFSVAGKIAELILPSTLEFIGNGVFDGHALTSLIIPENVTSIGYRAFNGNALSNINLPQGLNSISEGAFANNQLTGITLPDGLNSVGNYAFQNNKIANLVLPGGLLFIGYGAFQNNTITSITIPNTVETLGSSAFANNKITVLNFQSECKLTEISSQCFSNNNIQNITIPNSILIIDEEAFYGNASLINVNFGTNLLKIKRSAFSSCNLSSVKLPETLVFIGRFVFSNNRNLTSFNLPASAKNYQWNDSNGDKHSAGERVTNLSYSYVAIIPYTLKNEDVVVQNGIITSCSYFREVTNIASVITIPPNLSGQNILGIGTGVFGNCGISEVFLPQSISRIDNGAFQDNEIIALELPAGLQKIGDGAFNDNCINSLTFEANSSLEIIGKDAFSTNRLININFPPSVIKIEKYAFAYNFLQKITFEESSKLISLASYAFAGNRQLSSLTLPDPAKNNYEYWIDWNGVKYSTTRTVTNFESFYKIPIEYTLTDKDVLVENGVIISYTPGNPYANILTIPDILDGQKITGIQNASFRANGLIGVILPANLNSIGSSAFAENDLLRITIPKNVQTINNSAFYGNNIIELNFEEHSRLQRIGGWAFGGNKISSIILPDTLKTVENYAFAYNRIANNLTIPDSLKYIGWSAFASNRIPQLFFGENSTLTYLGGQAFAYNTISNEIFIPKTLSEISDYAFAGNQISKVITHEKVVDYGNGAFVNNNPALKITLHKPPTIPMVTHFFWWKDNDDNHYDPGEIIKDYSKRYKAVIDQYFVVKFVVTDNNNDPVENAAIEFYGNSLKTDMNGIDSIGPVYRGIQNYKVSATGCYGVNGSVDVQDDMTVLVTLIRYYNVNITVVDINNNPISDAGIEINGTALTSGANGTTRINLPNGEYPIITSAVGYRESTTPLTILDSGKDIIVILNHVVVNYFPNGGTGAPFSETTTAVTYKTVGNSYSKAAYNFSHWNTESDNSGTTYAENTSISLEYSDIDLYAIWTPVDYNIIYHLDGGQNDPSNPVKYNIESEINLLPASKPTLYFATWLKADSSRISKIQKGNTGDIELWAVFTTEPTYFIDYHNLENASHNNQPVYTKFDLPFTFTNAYKRGYEFIAWYGDLTLQNQITNIPVGSTANYDIYAKWGKAIEYTINYHLDGGTNNSANPPKYTIESDTVIFEKPLKPGAVFIAWHNDQDLTRKISKIPTGSTGDTAIYAQWELDVFNIGYALNGGFNHAGNPTDYTIESDPIIFQSPSKPGATFGGWHIDNALTQKITGIPTGSIGDTTVYASWDLINYEIQYILNGGDNHPENLSFYTIESEPVLFKQPEKTGAEFIGWYNNKEMTTEITGIPSGSTGDTMLYAKWELAIYDIDYILNGGNNSPENPLTFTIESDTIFLNNPDKPGFIFNGWFADVNFNMEMRFIPAGSLGDIKLYAKWTELFTVNFEITTDGKNPARAVEIAINKTFTMKTDLSGLADTIVPDGSYLQYSVEINGIVIDSGFVTVSGSDVTITSEIVDCYIRWYDVLFCDNGKGLWTGFAWQTEGNQLSKEQFYHQPVGIEERKYTLFLTSVAGVEYVWEKDFKEIKFWDQDDKTSEFELSLYPVPVAHENKLNICLSEEINLQTCKIFIYSFSGALIKIINNPLYMNEINIDSNFSSGLYHVILNDEKNKKRDVKIFIVN
jgi:uncharacterized repeat protein (TIGR02543 family)